MIPKTPCLKYSLLKSPMLGPTQIDLPRRAASLLDLNDLDLEYPGVSGLNVGDNASRLSIEDETPPTK